MILSVAGSHARPIDSHIVGEDLAGSDAGRGASSGGGCARALPSASAAPKAI